LPVEEGEDLFRVSSEIVVPILEAPGHILDPDQFFLFGAKQIESLLLGSRGRANLLH
jgi:hypothetical protein